MVSANCLDCLLYHFLRIIFVLFLCNWFCRCACIFILDCHTLRSQIISTIMEINRESDWIETK